MDCPHALRCGVRRLACIAFETFVHRGDDSWRNEPREPSARMFAKIFKSKKLAA
jgi:hypothetical protein